MSTDNSTNSFRRKEVFCPDCFVRMMLNFLDKKPIDVAKIEQALFVAKELGIKQYADISKLEILLESMPPDFEYQMAYELGVLQWKADVTYGHTVSHYKKPEKGSLWAFGEKLMNESKGINN